MSNTSTVTPYSGNVNTTATGSIAGTLAGTAAVCIAGAGVATVMAGKWLMEQNPEERMFHEEERLREAKGMPRQHLIPEMNRIASVPLAVQNHGSLIQAAGNIGYRLEKHTAATLNKEGAALFPLINNNGNRLLLEKTATGNLVVHAPHNDRVIQQLMRQHTVDAAMRHFAAKGMQVQKHTLTNGELEIRAEETPVIRGNRDKASIKAQVQQNGAVIVDVDRVKGNRCEQIVSEFAEAIGGDVVGMKKKDAYFQLPGEPVKTQQHIK